MNLLAKLYFEDVPMRHAASSIAAISACLLVTLGACTDSETHWGDNDNQQQNQATNGNDDDHNDLDNSDNDTNGDDSEGLNGPPSMTFDDTDIGDERTESMTLINFGDEAVEIDDVTISGAPFTVDPAPTEWPAEIEPNEPLDVAVTYGPEDTDAHSGELSVDWYDGDEQRLDVALVGNQPCLDADPMVLDFEDIDIGETETATTTIENCGVTTFGLTATFDYGGDEPDPEPLSIVGEDTLTAELQSGDSGEITVEFAPQVDYEPFDVSLLVGADPGDRELTIAIAHPFADVTDDGDNDGEN